MPQRFSITLTQLSYFVECAKALNMTVASQQLHVAQSAISTAISQLERSLGTTLFIRQHSKGIVLTPAGEKLLRDTQQLFGQLNDTIDSIHEDQRTVRGSISIACFSTLAPFLLPELLSRLQREHPELSVEVVEGDYETNLAALRRGRAEISIGYALTRPEGIDRRPIATARPYILLPDEHRLAGEQSIGLAELADEPFVLLDLPDSRDYFLSMLRAAGIEGQPKFRSASYETVRSMVASGLGYSILNQRPRTDQTYTGRRATTVEIEGEVPSLRVVLSSLAQVELSARARAVAATLAQVIDEHPGMLAAEA